MLRLAEEIKNEIKKVLKDIKYKDTESGREIAFSTAYSRGNQKAINDYKELLSRFKEKEKEKQEKKKTKKQVQLTKKVKIEELPSLNEKTIKNIMSLDSWMVKKRKALETEFKESKSKIDKNYIEEETKIVEDANLSDEDKEKALSKLEKKYQKQLSDNQKYMKTKNQKLKEYSSFNKEDVEALSNIFNNIPNDIVEDEKFLENFVDAQNTFNRDYKSKETHDALEEIDKEIKQYRSIKDITKEIKKIKESGTEDSDKLNKLREELGQVSGALFIRENVVLNPSTGLPKFKNKKFMTPKVMTKLFESQQERYSKLPPKEKNIMVSKLETKLKNADSLQKEVLEKAMDGALGSVFSSSKEEKKEIKIPKTRIIPDPKLMELANKFNRLEEVCESTRISNEPKTNREMTSKLLHSLSDEEFIEAIGESALYKPMLQVLDPNYCPMHPKNQSSGPDVSDKDCPVRVSEKDKIRIKNNLIELYQDSSYFVSGGVSFESSGYDDFDSYSKKVESTKKEISNTKTPSDIEKSIRKLTENITNHTDEDVLSEAEASKLSLEIRSKVTQDHINKFGEITTALMKTLELNRAKSNEDKMRYLCNAFKEMPGFPKLPGC